ncbi:hypothetical protein EQJ92_05190 [Pediococcus acidilactici]|uniref:hypothetical protein n=1 Tax=Pediococcus acidilactici TaxID=1254 RepID=UPI000FFCCBAA|nr:hypothetical protein [Pediococcus acidilactici]QAR71174.1 hypothetical protein EQJ92_05190 [Pediococcus acidilactici]
MKLVKIDDYTYANPALIGAIECGRFGTDIYLAGSNKPIETLAKIGKVLDTLCGSEEHLEDSDNKYNISVTTDNTGINKIGTKSDVLSLLNELKTDETLTIKRSK